MRLTRSRPRVPALTFHDIATDRLLLPEKGEAFYRIREVGERAAGFAPTAVSVSLAPERPRPPRLTEPWFC